MTCALIAIVEATDTARAGELRDRLETEIIPRTKAVPGFQKGYWFADTENERAGAVVLLFESEEAAHSAPAPPSDAPVKVHSRALYRLVAEA